ncbi:MAG: MFS transporter [Acidimicrobiia bacterium]
MNRIRQAGRQTFRSLETPNYRKYLTGQVISASGSWVQQIALTWLVVKLTHGNGIAVGLVTALQFTPVLLGGAWAGVLADRLDKRRVLVGTSLAAGVCAAVLGWIVLAGLTQLWMVYALAAAFGAATALDSPTRRAFVTELVPDDHAQNAVSLNSSVFTTARVVGPTVGAFLIATAGIGWCFVANSLSFVAVIVALLAMDVDAIRPSAPLPRRKGQLREGLRYVQAHATLRTTLLMTAVIGTLSFNFQVTISLMARKVFGGDAGTFGALYALMSAGAVVASLVVAHRETVHTRFVVISALGLGVAMTAAAVVTSIELFAVTLVLIGLTSIAFLSSAGALAQSRAAPEFRGRVAALFAVAFLGSTPIGGPIVGAVSQAFGARFGLLLGGVTALVTGVVALRALNARRTDLHPVSSPAAA